MQICFCVRILVYVLVCMCLYVCVSVCMCACMHICVCVCVCVCEYMCVCVGMRVHACVYITFVSATWETQASSNKERCERLLHYKFNLYF